MMLPVTIAADHAGFRVRHAQGRRGRIGPRQPARAGADPAATPQGQGVAAAGGPAAQWRAGGRSGPGTGGPRRPTARSSPTAGFRGYPATLGGFAKFAILPGVGSRRLYVFRISAGNGRNCEIRPAPPAVLEGRGRLTPIRDCILRACGAGSCARWPARRRPWTCCLFRRAGWRG